MDQGVPHSVFLGRDVLPGSPLWTHEDRQKVHAVLRDRMDRCAKCGTYDVETRDELGRVRSDQPYATTTHRCHVCEMAEIEAALIPSDAKGVTVRIVKKNPMADEDEEGD